MILPPTAGVPRVTVRALLLGFAIALLASLCLPATAHADAPARGPSDEPVDLVIATAGLTWEDVSGATPNLQCLAGRSGTAAMSISSMTPLTPTKRQGMETLTSGHLGLAEQSHRAARSPQPAEDLLSSMDEPVTVEDVGALPARGMDEGPVDPSSARGKALDRLDERVGSLVEAEGGCTSPSLSRVLLVSVAPFAPSDPAAVEEGRTRAPGPSRLQVVMDSGFAGGPLTSGSTHQDGVVLLTDIAPTILASHGEAIPEGLPGQVLEGTPTASDGADGAVGTDGAGASDGSGIRLAKDRSAANLLVDGASMVALGSWLLLPALGLLVLLVTSLARRRRLAAIARAAVVCLPLGPAAGIVAGILPWWRAGHPTLALTGVVWGIGLLLAAIVLLGPWRRVRYGPAGVAGALLALVLLVESATGSRLQLGSPLGAQAIRGGRFYGISNHMSGLVLAGTMIALLALCMHLRRPRTRVLAVLGIGLVVMGVSAAPTMGADFGSVLVLVPALGLLALLLSGIRVRAWHLLAIVGAAVVIVGGISVLDWMRPPEQRTHLGRFVDQVLSGELLGVVASKVQQNLDQVTTFWPLVLVLALAAVLWVCSLMPRRTRMRRLATLDAEHPVARPVRLALGIGAWIGYASNDTGAMLLLAALAVSVPLLTAMLPDPGPASASASDPASEPASSAPFTGPARRRS